MWNRGHAGSASEEPSKRDRLLTPNHRRGAKLDKEAESDRPVLWCWWQQLGAQAAGVKIVAAFDMWSVAESVYRDNFPDVKFYSGRIEEHESIRS